MGTTIRDLLSTLENHVRYAPRTERHAGDPAGALVELGRALRRLADDGLELQVNGRRERIIADLAESCTHSAAGLTTGRSDRLTGLAGAVADVIGVRREETGREQRWAITVELARAVRVLATYAYEGDDRRTDELVWTHRIARAVIVQALQDTASAPSGAALDTAVPRTMLPADLPASGAALESLTVISNRLRRSATGLSRRPTLLEIFAVTRAAEATTRYATTTMAMLTGQPMPQAQPAVVIWRDVRDQLQPFTTAAPLRAEDHDLGVWAQRAHGGLRREFGAPEQPKVVTQGGGLKISAVRNLHAMLNEIPAIAGHLATTVQHLGDQGELHALATQLPFREERLDAFLSGRGVIADRFDLVTVLDRLVDAAKLAAELATTLDRASDTTATQSQPAMLRENADRATIARPDPHAALLYQVRDGTPVTIEHRSTPATEAVPDIALCADADETLYPAEPDIDVE